jgi:transposase
MSSVIIAVNLAKCVFEIAVANQNQRITERRRLTRAQFERFWSTRAPCRVVMEACGSAHFWARHLLGLGFEVILPPPQYVQPYRRRRPIAPTARLCSRRCAAAASTRSASRARTSRRSLRCTGSARNG